MTAEKFNAIKENCKRADKAGKFDEIFKNAQLSLALVIDTMTAEQIAAVIEFGFSQYLEGKIDGIADSMKYK